MTSLLERVEYVDAEVQLGDFFPEKLKLKINGELHEAWVTKNNRYPRPIQAKLDRAYAKWMRIAQPILLNSDSDEYRAEFEKLSDEDKQRVLEARARAVDESDLAYQEYITTALMLLIPTLDETTAEMIPQEVAEGLFRQLGYFLQNDALAEERATREASEDAAPLIGASSTQE